MELTALTQLRNLFSRVASYPAWEIFVELTLIGLIVYLIVRFVEGTRAAGALKGLLVVLVIATAATRLLGGADAFQRLTYLYDRFLAVIAIGLVIIFQPELRRALIRLGEAPIFRTTPKEIESVVEAVISAAGYLSKTKMGALIVFERRVGLEGLVEGGTKLNAEVSPALLQTIFFPGTALHDLAVVIRGRLITAASVQLPLAEPTEMSDPSFGSRHRAAVGLTKECDAVVVVISEETGLIRIAERGKLSASMDLEKLRAALVARLDGAGGAANPSNPADGSAPVSARSPAADPEAPDDEDLEASQVPTNDPSNEGAR
ncbi:MAG: diadenylate cyclase CdaA [Planctomycetota bacterium]